MLFYCISKWWINYPSQFLNKTKEQHGTLSSCYVWSLKKNRTSKIYCTPTYLKIFWNIILRWGWNLKSVKWAHGLRMHGIWITPLYINGASIYCLWISYRPTFNIMLSMCPNFTYEHFSPFLSHEFMVCAMSLTNWYNM